jgi:DNA invertase Pin-like site-specific DNA recombinase
MVQKQDSDRRLIGYARVSTEDQRLDVQLEDLRQRGCDPIFSDKLSGSQDDRPGLTQALGLVQSGDVLVVHRIDRLGRSLPHLLRVLEDLQARGVVIRSTTEGLDTSTPAGRMVMTVLGSVAQYETELRRERQAAGIAVAKRRGVYKGRKPKLRPEQEAQVVKMLAEGSSVGEVASVWEISRWTVRRIRGRAHATP